MRAVDGLVAGADVGVRDEVDQLVGAASAHDPLGIEPVVLGDSVAQRRRAAIGIEREVVCLGLVGRDRLGRRPERRLVGGELDRLQAARHFAFARNVGADVQDAGLRLGRGVRHEWLVMVVRDGLANGRQNRRIARRLASSACETSQTVVRYFASSRERRAAAATALRISVARPSSAISTCRAANVVPLGEVTFWRSTAGSRSERCSSSPAPATVQQASCCASVWRQPGVDPGFGHAFGEIEHVGRTRAGHSRHRIHKAFVVDPGDLSDGPQQLVAGRRAAPASRERCRRPR